MTGAAHGFWLCFVPLFAALNPISVVPLFAGMVEGLSEERRRRIVVQSLATASAVSLAFLFGGKALFRLLGVTVADFMVAGGLLLFLISLRDLTQRETHPSARGDEALGAVPIGVPLIVGPATLTTLLLLNDQHGPVATIAALLVNLALVGLILHSAARIQRWLGKAGTRALAKVSALLLAAIAVKIARRGLQQILAAPDL
ncbi:MAG: MarC family protein [Kiritimatiellae bacterium]|nr:MarC family protein [Kiritimatiellia bacterium]